MLDIGQIACFLAIVKHGSFTRAAEALGVAQSAVSQKLLRLEDQLNIVLLQRTSRTLALTREGQEFLPFARNILDAEAKARHAAQSMVQRAKHIVRIGTMHLLVDERAEVISGYLSQVPDGQIGVEFGARHQLLRMLQDDLIDCCLCVGAPECPGPGIEEYRVRKRVAYLMFPHARHPLAGRAAIELTDLRDLELVISPGREDSPMLEAFAQTLTASGAVLNRAPDSDRRLIEAYARSRALPCLRWLPQGTPRHEVDGQPVIPIRDDPFSLDYVIYFPLGTRSGAAERFRRFVQAIAIGPPRGQAPVG